MSAGGVHSMPITHFAFLGICAPDLFFPGLAFALPLPLDLVSPVLSVESEAFLRLYRPPVSAGADTRGRLAGRDELDSASSAGGGEENRTSRFLPLISVGNDSAAVLMLDVDFLWWRGVSQLGAPMDTREIIRTIGQTVGVE